VDDLAGIRVAAAIVAPLGSMGVAAFLLLVLGGVLWRPSTGSLVVLLVAIPLSYRLMGGSRDYFANDACKLQPDVYGAIVDAASWLMETDPLYRRVRLWFDEEEVIYPIGECPVRLGYMGYSMTSMASTGYVVRPNPMPGVADLPETSVRELTQGDRLLIIVSNQDEPLEAWRRRIEALGLAHEEVDRYRVGVLSSGFTMHVWSVAPPSR
jgi:hypothetical protein